MASDSVYKVVHEFLTTSPGEMCVSKGDVVLVIERTDKLWCKCELLPNGPQGDVPFNNLLQLEPPPVKPGQVLFVAVSDFGGQQSGDLMMLKGDFVIGTHKIDDNWWHGQSGFNSGMFPVSYVKQLDAGQDKLRQARVKKSMVAQLEEEVDLFEGDTVTISGKVDNSFFRGTSRGMTGIFPSAFVEIINEKDIEASGSNHEEVEYRSLVKSTKELEQFGTINFSHPQQQSDRPPSYATSTRNDYSREVLDQSIVRPYGISLYPFYAQFENELSFGEGEVIYLIDHVDQDWIKGEYLGQKGIFPANYVNVVVDCAAPPKTTPAEAAKSTLEVRAFAKVVFDFDAQMQGDVSVTSEDVVFLESVSQDGQWATVKKQDGASGLCPMNFLEALDLNVPAPRVSTSSASSLDDLIARNISAMKDTPINRNSFINRPPPPSSPPPMPPAEEEIVPAVSYQMRVPPKPPLKESAVPNSAPDVPKSVTDSVLSRTGSVRVPLRLPPPVPSPKPLPVAETLDEIPETPKKPPPATVINSKEKMQEQRQNVIAELAITEKDFIRDLKITYETFNLHNPQQLEARGVDANLLFGNILEIIKLSETLLDKILTAMKGKKDEDQLIAPCFLELADEMKVTYTNYCINNDNSLALLTKYADDEDIQRLFQKGLETLHHQIACFDMSSIIIKPVQRIMKYPLILNELYKSTEDDHADKGALLEAVKAMSEVASEINEAKRRQDIVSKYLGDGMSTLSTKISRISLHSMAKKSTRFGAKLSSSLGIGTNIKDQAFEELERAFYNIEKGTRNFVRGIEQVLFHLNEVIMSQLNTSEAVYDFYNESVANNDEYRICQLNIANELFPQFKSSLNKYVLGPMNTILELASGPAILVQKRNDKRLDYESLMYKFDKNKDIKLQEELNLAKNTYEALNTQLLEELPTFVELAESFFVDCVSSYIRARKIFSAKAAKQYLNLMELPIMSGYTGDPAEVFKVKHNLVCHEVAQLSFTSKNFKSESGTLRRESKVSSPQLGADLNTNKAQGHGQKAFLQSRYPHSKLYKAVESWSTKELLEVSLVKDDIVAVIKQQDPMGNVERWFIDTGEIQGFVPSQYLQPLYPPSPQPEPKFVYDKLLPAPPPYQEDSDSSSNIYEELPEFEFAYAEYDFDSINDNTLGIRKGQVLKVLQKQDLQGNDEWWLVEDREAHQGYVPANYLKRGAP